VASRYAARAAAGIWYCVRALRARRLRGNCAHQRIAAIENESEMKIMKVSTYKRKSARISAMTSMA